MDINTYSFFLVVLSGFMFLWSFRKFAAIKESFTDFEYLGFSSFVGILILAGYGWLTREQPDDLKSLLSNPLLAGVVLSSVAFIIGSIAGGIVGYLKNKAD